MSNQTIRWITRNDQPAETGIAHAYTENEDTSLCDKIDRSNFDWTEFWDIPRCSECCQTATLSGAIEMNGDRLLADRVGAECD